jgi:arylsulfatase A-like enzyme
MSRWLFVLLLAALGLNVANAADSRPHIVVVLADDLGPGDLGCYGGQVAPTPNLDRLAREGTRFTRYYSPAPICSPARCGLLIGQFPARWQITSFLQDKKGNRACEQVDFLDPQAAGYATAHFGKWHLGGGRDVTAAPKFAEYGYDEAAGTWESPEPHPDITASNWIWSDKDKVKRWDRTAFFVDRTLQFLKAHPDHPCFVNVWLDDPHTPWVPEATPPGGNNRPNLAKVLKEVDRQMGRLMQEVPPNTLLLFISDNGPLPTFQGKRTTNLRGSKLSLYEGGIRVPFLARWPGKIPAGKVDETSTIAGVDLLPTLAAIAQAKLPDGYVSDGEDVSAALLGQAFERTKPLLWEYGRNNTSFKYPGNAADRSPWLAIRSGKWKLLAQADGSNVELYDVIADPQEKQNVATDQPTTVQVLTQQLLEWKRSLPKFTPTN